MTCSRVPADRAGRRERWRAPGATLCVLVLVASSAYASACRPAAEATTTGDSSRGPRVLDDRLQLSLFAEDPDIVTPIGIASDGRGRLFVLESHTHLPPSGYEGPTHDRVKILEDTNGDGRADRVQVFADGFTDGMNLGFSPDGELYLVAAQAVWAIHDRDGDGVSEARTRVLELAEPAQVYPHAALLGLAFSSDGWLYVSRGNTGGSAWMMVGTDGSRVSGYGDGGNIMRARPDGSRLEEVATGFWNPFDIVFDVDGRLLAADNDPDSRGPNRLVHVIPGGDYGYHSLHGESGIHPYLAWDGELPGTLPYAASLGEAPSGLLDTSRTSLPADAVGHLLCTIWEESRIVSIRLTSQGASVRGETTSLVEGDGDFRPVAFAAAPDGGIFITDWVVREYPNHGRGRVWRLSVRPGVDVGAPRHPRETPPHDPAAGALHHISRLHTPADLPRLRELLTSADPFERSAAVTALTNPAFRDWVKAATGDPDGDVRLGAVLALQRADVDQPEALAAPLLSDPDPRVRQMTLVWIGRAGMTSLAPQLERALSSGAVSRTLFETYVETVRFTQPAFVEAYRRRSERASKSIPRPLPDGFIEALVADGTRPPDVRAAAILHLEDPSAHVALLETLARSAPDATLRLEAIRSLAMARTSEGGEALLAVVNDSRADGAARADAVLALSAQPDVPATTVIPLLTDPDVQVRVEAARALRAHAGNETVRDAASKAHANATAAGDEAFREQLVMVLGESAEAQDARPASADAWLRALDAGGDAARGRRVFFSVHAACSACHVRDGRGGTLGPDLSNVGLSKTRRQLLDAVLQPSAEVSPEWQGWFIRTTAGETHVGRQIDVGDKAVDLYTLGAGFITVAKADIETYGMADTSLMPAGLETQLTVSDMRDLFAFLEKEHHSARSSGDVP